MEYFSFDTLVYVVMEYIEAGTLQDAVKKYGVFSEDLTGKYIGQILNALAYLHSKGIVHRDIKGANIMITKEGTTKLVDFGIANQWDPSQKLISCVGTPYWSMSTFFILFFFFIQFNIEFQKEKILILNDSILIII
jgi:serine/threonine protein kinase